MQILRHIELLFILCLVCLGCGLGEGMPPDSARIYQIMQDKATELGSINAKVELDRSTPISGKIAIIYHWNNVLEKPGEYSVVGFTQYYDGIAKSNVLEAWGLAPDTLALKPDEIETLVRITCKRGDRGPDFSAPSRGPVPAYAMECLVDVIDYKNFTIFARQAFRNFKIEDDKKVLPIDKEVVASPPYDDIEDYIKNFKRK